MAIAPYRVFVDTSVYIAALISPEGGAGEIMRLAEAGVMRMVVSEEVIIEADRVISSKFPELLQENRQLWKALRPEVVKNPTVQRSKLFLQKLEKGDALILCAAYHAQVMCFVTWNTRDFMASGIAPLVNFPIVVPKDCLILFRKWIEPFLN